MFVIVCGIACILVAAVIGWEIFEGNINKDSYGIFGFTVFIITSVVFALFGGFLIGTKISDNVAGVEEFKAEDYYLDYRINFTQVNGRVVSRDTTYVLTRKD